MVKFLKPNKAVIILQGRYAGRKAVIIRNFDDGTRDRSYGHCLVAGLAKYPRKVIRKDSAKKQAKKSRVKCFIKLGLAFHHIPTPQPTEAKTDNLATASDAIATIFSAAAPLFGGIAIDKFIEGLSCPEIANSNVRLYSVTSPVKSLTAYSAISSDSQCAKA
ncbi:unnamed protein product [Fraxinus pennsylvanica]|uniref:60S ribosomal protein L27 n=1 Tax=Fraxinus pennsylvanica TaxID=56036 RepID=A0AAD1ZYT0_9LAMI|nr:unnamed protein product [Fraxinus pennsylvanica]